MPDFLRFVTESLKPLFNFHDCGIFLLTENGEKHYDIAIEKDVSKSEANETIAMSGIELMEHRGSAIAWAMDEIEKQNAPVLFDFNDLVTRFPEYHQFQVYDHASVGYGDSLAANLTVGNKVLGMFCINALEKDFFKKEQFSLFKSVTDQLSVAVSNILANEDILKREREKTLLLQITENVTRLRDMPDFLTLH